MKILSLNNNNEIYVFCYAIIRANHHIISHPISNDVHHKYLDKQSNLGDALKCT